MRSVTANRQCEGCQTITVIDLGFCIESILLDGRDKKTKGNRLFIIKQDNQQERLV